MARTRVNLPFSPMEPSPPAAPRLPLATQSLLLGDPTRIAILRELCRGEPLPVSEIARRLWRAPTAMSKHLALLRRTGVAVQGFGRLYRMAPALQPPPGATALDLGELTLKLSARSG